MRPWEKKQDSEVGDQAGRAPFYLVFDEKGTLLETVNNPFSRGGGGAGFGVAKMLADKEVNLAVAGQFGEKIIQAMNERGLRVFEYTGTVGEALAALDKE